MTCIYSLKKVKKTEFLIFLIDYGKPKMNINNLKIQNKNQNILYTQTEIIYMVIQCLNFFKKVDSNGQR